MASSEDGDESPMEWNEWNDPQQKEPVHHQDVHFEVPKLDITKLDRNPQGQEIFRLRVKMQKLEFENKLLKSSLEKAESSYKSEGSRAEALQRENTKLKDERARFEKMVCRTVESLQNSSKEIDKRRKDLVLTKEVGSGASGIVYEGTLPVVVKKLRDTSLFQTFEREMGIGSRCWHPNVVRYLVGGRHKDGSLFIVMEKMDSNLREFLDNYHHQLQPETMKHLLLDIAKGLCYLHSNGITHRDVKPQNILLRTIEGRFVTAKIGDLGTANCKCISPNRGSPTYAAPEGLTTDKQSPKMDVYSYGLVMLEVITGKRPERDQIQKLLQQVANLYPREAELIKRCIQSDPAGRPSMEQIVTWLCR